MTPRSGPVDGGPSPPLLLAGQRRSFRLVAIGGGTGLAGLLSGLKREVGGEVESLTAVVTVADDGGSSGRLRREFGVLPPGDIRNCIAALADDEDLLARLFRYRFGSGDGLSGHSFGNLFLTALAELTGDFYQAILTAESILSVRGRILPSTLTPVELHAWGESGRTYAGESEVGKSGESLARVVLAPDSPPAFPPALEALLTADLVILGPGSLYTSILPNLLIPEIRQAIRRSEAKVVLPLNLMTQPGETDGMSGLAHLEALERHTQTRIVDSVLVHAGAIPEERLQGYELQGSRPVAVDREILASKGLSLFEVDLLAEGDLVRHDPHKLARALIDLAAGRHIRVA